MWGSCKGQAMVEAWLESYINNIFSPCIVLLSNEDGSQSLHLVKDVKDPHISVLETRVANWVGSSYLFSWHQNVKKNEVRCLTGRRGRRKVESERLLSAWRQEHSLFPLPFPWLVWKQWQWIWQLSDTHDDSWHLKVWNKRTDQLGQEEGRDKGGRKKSKSIYYDGRSIEGERRDACILVLWLPCNLGKVMSLILSSYKKNLRLLGNP